MSKPHISFRWATLYSDLQNLVFHFGNSSLCWLSQDNFGVSHNCQYHYFRQEDDWNSILQLYSRLWEVIRKKIERIHSLTPKEIWRTPGSHVATGTCSNIRKKNHQIRVSLLGILSECVCVCLLLKLFIPSQPPTVTIHRVLKIKSRFC